jgi:hypothetical protein
MLVSLGRQQRQCNARDKQLARNNSAPLRLANLEEKRIKRLTKARRKRTAQRRSARMARSPDTKRPLGAQTHLITKVERPIRLVSAADGRSIVPCSLTFASNRFPRRGRRVTGLLQKRP